MQCGQALGDLINLNTVRFIAFSCLFVLGLEQYCQRCRGGKKEVREESKTGKRWEERNPSLNTGLKAQAVFET